MKSAWLRKYLKVLVVLVPLVVLFGFVAVRTGPFAAVAVTEGMVDKRSIVPGLFGVGTVEARYVFRIGPTIAGRVKWLSVDVGDRVKAGQVLGEMDPVDLDERIEAQRAGIKRAEGVLQQEVARQAFAASQAERYEKLRASQTTSEEVIATKRQELKVADAALEAAKEDVVRLRAEQDALSAQRANLRLVAPVDGLVTAREVDPGTTVVAGQTVIELVDPASLWIEARFDQISSEGLKAGLEGKAVLRSQPSEEHAIRLLRIEPKADVVTEEMLAKIVFEELPESLPPIGELVEVTVELEALPAMPVIPNAALHAVGGRRGVWKLNGQGVKFVSVVPGRSDLEGNVQIKDGLLEGERFVLYSEKEIKPRSRVRVVEHIEGVKP